MRLGTTLAFAFSSMILIYLLITFIGQSIFQTLNISDGLTFFIVSSLYSITAILLVLLFSRIMYKRTLVQITGVKKFNIKYAVLAIALAVGMFLGLGFVNSLFNNLLEKSGIVLGSRTLPLDNFGQFLIVVFFVCVLPAVFEEIFFRGFMLNSLDGVKVWQGALFVAVCFSLYHCSFTQLVYQFIYGGLLCLLASSARSTLPCVIAHFINNFAVVVLIYLGVNIDLFNPVIIACGLVVLSLVMTILVIGLKKRPLSVEDTEERQGEKLDFWIPVGLFGTVMCLIVLLSNLFMAV